MLIDIVVPIYNAYDAVKQCLISLEMHDSDANQITLINDASTDSKISPLIEEFTDRNNWGTIKHAVNQGFVVTANQGLKLSKNNTLLLNSDTIVSKNWLKAFIAALSSNENIGTITAWSNNAEICSFPKFLCNNHVPKKLDVLSEILYQFYKPQYPIIPTAVGFCMLISKQAKEVVGYFDEEQFGHGYGEENDYSLRVIAKGLKNILCDNVYVAHAGNQSFSDFGLKPSEETMQRLLQKHPNYLQEIHKYIEKDPLAPIREEMLDIIKQNDNQLHNQLLASHD